MKTISIKFPEDEAIELEEFVKKRNYPPKSKFIRNLLIEKFDRTRKEKIGWMLLAEKSMTKIWNNKKDDEVWNKYL